MVFVAVLGLGLSQEGLSAFEGGESMDTARLALVSLLSRFGAALGAGGGGGAVLSGLDSAIVEVRRLSWGGGPSDERAQVISLGYSGGALGFEDVHVVAHTRTSSLSLPLSRRLGRERLAKRPQRLQTRTGCASRQRADKQEKRATVS